MRFLLEEVEEMTKIGRFAMVVLGDSGSGQSELMRAGLAPSLLRRLVGRDRRTWRVAYAWLKEEPTREVLSALAQGTEMPVEKGTPADMHEVLRRVERNSDFLALVIDNCERLTREGWQDKRAALFDLIGKLRTAAAGRFFLVISERKGNPRLVCPPEWGEVKTWELPIFGEQGMRDFLSGGAKLFGVGWEPDALDRAMSEAAGLRATPQITGLLLRETLSQREGRTITFKSYVRMGGVAQVIASHAGETLSRLVGEAQDAAKRIILRLVSAPGRTKRTLAFNDLVAIAGGGVEHGNAIVCLLDHGILRVHVGEAYALRTSQIADVEPVRTWLQAETRSVTTTARLEQAVEEWEKSERAPSATARGGALLEFERLTPLLQKEKEFLAQSREMESLARLGQDRVPANQSRSVFLAECTPDLERERLNMKLFIEAKGWPILPESNYDDANYEALLERDLRASLAFVQLIGPHPWKRGDFDVRQNEKAKALGVPRFRHRDPGIEMNSVAEPHRTFMSAPDVIASGLEDFKTYVDHELGTLWQARQKPERPGGATIPLVRVAVLAKNRDQLWDQAYDWLQSSNILVSLLRPEESFEEKQRVEPCHGFLILCDAAALDEGPLSLRDQIDQCRIIQMREKDAARRPPVGLVYWPPPTPVWARLVRSAALNMHRIVADLADAPAKLEYFLAEVRRVAL